MISAKASAIFAPTERIFSLANIGVVPQKPPMGKPSALTNSVASQPNGNLMHDEHLSLRTQPASRLRRAIAARVNAASARCSTRLGVRARQQNYLFVAFAHDPAEVDLPGRRYAWSRCRLDE